MVESAAATLVQKPSPFLILPLLRVESAVLRYRLGEIVPSALGDDTDAFSLAVQLRAQSIALGNAFKAGRLPDSVWLESIQSLTNLARSLGGHRVALSTKEAEDYRSRFEQIQLRLKQSIELHARADGLVAKSEERGVGSTTAFTPKGFSLALRTNPPGGKIRMVKTLTYVKETRLMGLSDQQVSWITLTGSTNTLMGRYRYLVVWPGGRKSQGEIDIQHDIGAIEFTPDDDRAP